MREERVYRLRNEAPEWDCLPKEVDEERKHCTREQWTREADRKIFFFVINFFYLKIFVVAVVLRHLRLTLTSLMSFLPLIIDISKNT